MWFAVGPALSGLGLEGLPKALFAIRPQGWRDEPRRYRPFRNLQNFFSFSMFNLTAGKRWMEMFLIRHLYQFLMKNEF